MIFSIISGYKFETLSLIPNTWAATPREVIENRENETVNNHAQYCSIVKTGIGKARLIIGGEVDAGKPTAHLQPPVSLLPTHTITAKLTTLQYGIRNPPTKTTLSTGSSLRRPQPSPTTAICSNTSASFSNSGSSPSSSAYRKSSLASVAETGSWKGSRN